MRKTVSRTITRSVIPSIKKGLLDDEEECCGVGVEVKVEAEVGDEDKDEDVDAMRAWMRVVMRLKYWMVIEDGADMAENEEDLVTSIVDEDLVLYSTVTSTAMMEDLNHPKAQQEKQKVQP